MEILYLLNTVVLGVMLWDIHRGVSAMQASLERITRIADAISAKTDALLLRTAP
jgi:hypothetical protein